MVLSTFDFALKSGLKICSFEFQIFPPDIAIKFSIYFLICINQYIHYKLINKYQRKQKYVYILLLFDIYSIIMILIHNYVSVVTGRFTSSHYLIQFI